MKKYIIGLSVFFFTTIGLSYALPGDTVGKLFVRLSGMENGTSVSDVYRLVGQNVKDATVTTAELANSAVTSAKIVPLSVGGTKLSDSSVTTDKIQDGTIRTQDANSLLEAPFAFSANTSVVADTLSGKTVVTEILSPYTLSEIPTEKATVEFSKNYVKISDLINCTGATKALQYDGTNFTCIDSTAINGVCSGTANSCSKGKAGNFSSDSLYYYWDCLGYYGGSKVSCSKRKPIHGFCGSSVDTCSGGGFSDLPDTATEHRWRCIGSFGGATANCSSPISGGGGGGPTPSAPSCGSSINTCSPGNPVDIADTPTEYLWRCDGAGGASVNCSSPIPSGGGGGGGGPTPVVPSCGASLNSCSSGTFSDLTDTATNFLWRCNGTSGASVDCSLPKPPTGTCSDGIKNQDETGIDCGGVCGVCIRRVGPMLSDPSLPLFNESVCDLALKVCLNKGDNIICFTSMGGGPNPLWEATCTQ